MLKVSLTVSGDNYCTSSWDKKIITSSDDISVAIYVYDQIYIQDRILDIHWMPINHSVYRMFHLLQE